MRKRLKERVIWKGGQGRSRRGRKKKILKKECRKKVNKRTRTK